MKVQNFITAIDTQLKVLPTETAFLENAGVKP
jgi:hypothetical protein